MALLLECQRHSQESAPEEVSSFKTAASTLVAIYKDVKSSKQSLYIHLFAQGCLVAVKERAWHTGFSVIFKSLAMEDRESTGPPFKADVLTLGSATRAGQPHPVAEQ